MTTDEVTIVDGVAIKRHGGADGAERAARSARAMVAARAGGLPVPTVVGVTGRVLRARFVDAATSGAVVLHEDPVGLLTAIGRVARRLHDLPAPPDLPSAHEGGVWVHGDLCPVNVLLGGDARGAEVVTVLDWEDSRVDDPLIDLVWTEWLVRTWHVRAVDHLPALYAGYGIEPPPPADRRAVMTGLLRRQVVREGEAHAPTWRRHLDALPGLELGSEATSARSS